MNLMLQLQADQLGVPVIRPVELDTTALGAAFLAGLGVGVWGTLDEVAACRRVDVEVRPGPGRSSADDAHDRWLKAVSLSRGWASP